MTEKNETVEYLAGDTEKQQEKKQEKGREEGAAQRNRELILKWTRAGRKTPEIADRWTFRKRKYVECRLKNNLVAT